MPLVPPLKLPFLCPGEQVTSAADELLCVEANVSSCCLHITGLDIDYDKFTFENRIIYN